MWLSAESTSLVECSMGASKTVVSSVDVRDVAHWMVVHNEEDDTVDDDAGDDDALVVTVADVADSAVVDVEGGVDDVDGGLLVRKEGLISLSTRVCSS